MEKMEDFLQRKQREFWDVYSQPHLWTSSREMDRVREEIKVCFAIKDVTSPYFDSLRSRFSLISKLNRVYEDLLILNKFDPFFMMGQLKKTYSEYTHLKVELDQEKDLFFRLKMPPSALNLFCNTLENKVFDSLAHQHKLYEIRSFLAHHYGHIPRVRSTLVFYPAIPLKNN